MITSRTPLRLSLLGGGSDYPQFYIEHGGAILGTTINKYVYVSLHNGASWRTLDLPMKSGLASSSAYTVGLLRVCTELDKVTIAKLATVWEQDKMSGNVGSQDQYLCAVGGFHHLKFDAHGIRDIVLEPELVRPLQDYLMLFDTHQYRRASDVIVHQLAHLKRNTKLLINMRDMVEIGVNLLKEGNYIEFGRLINQTWAMKKQLSKYVSTANVDAIYETGIEAGAVGGKLLGGGGGGFIIFLVEPDKREAVKKALSGLTHVSFQFENEGTMVIFRD